MLDFCSSTRRSEAGLVRLLRRKGETRRFAGPSSASTITPPTDALLPPASEPQTVAGEAAYWKTPEPSLLREYSEVLGVIACVTVVGWFLPLSYHAIGQIYLLAVIALSLRVSRWPVLVAAVASAVTWNYVFMPPRLSFAVLDFDDSLILGTYFVVALIGGQLTTRVRAQARLERRREQLATALLRLTRALAAARTLDEAARAALRQAEEVFEARTALLLLDEKDALVPHEASSFRLSDLENAAAKVARTKGEQTGRFTSVHSTAQAVCVPMLRAGGVLGVLALRLPVETLQLTSAGQDLINGFAAQIALLIEREKLRAASEREKLLAESDRLHRTLLDSVSHELKTPLSVLRSATEKLDTDDFRLRRNLTVEIRTATERLNHLVANLLSQSRLESGGLSAQLDWCDVRDVISSARRAVGDALAGHVVKVQIPAELPLFMADAPLMEQVLGNLLLNAAVHTPRGTSICVRAGLEDAHDRVFIAVEDTGPGIASELRASLFQKFRRGNAARAGGLGLGLSIVRGFMLAQGGDVVAGTSPDGGACFTLYLPHVVHDLIPSDER